MESTRTTQAYILEWVEGSTADVSDDLTPCADLVSASSNPPTACGVIHYCMYVPFTLCVRLGPSRGLTDTLPLASTMFASGRYKTSFEPNENCHLGEQNLTVLCRSRFLLWPWWHNKILGSLCSNTSNLIRCRRYCPLTKKFFSDLVRQVWFLIFCFIGRW